jgi:DNA processing protein
VPERTVLYPSSASWPQSLRDLSDPPRQLRIVGTLPSFAGAVAIVGTRIADAEALEATTRWAAVIAGSGRTIVSGGALGIDAAAHRGALSVGAATVAVLPTGFSPTYPPEHDALFEDIARSGALVSEQPDGMPPRPGTFLARNRLIAALAEQVVVVQAPFRSGALSTAALAKRLGKPVWAVPAAPWDALGGGFPLLLRRGARICTSPKDVLSVPAQNRPPTPPEVPSDELQAVREAVRDSGGNLGNCEGLDEISRAVLGALGRRPRHPDGLCTELSLPLADLLGALLELELLGRIESCGDGTYRACPAPSPG